MSFGSSGLGSAALVSPSAGFSRGATGAGSSILGGFSSTLAGVERSDLGLGLKKSPTRADSRRPTLAGDLILSSLLGSSFFSSLAQIITDQYLTKVLRAKHNFRELKR